MSEQKPEGKNVGWSALLGVLSPMVFEASMRFKAAVYPLIFVDGTWDLGAHLVGGITPWGGVWFDGRNTARRFRDLPPNAALTGAHGETNKNRDA